MGDSSFNPPVWTGRPIRINDFWTLTRETAWPPACSRTIRSAPSCAATSTGRWFRRTPRLACQRKDRGRRACRRPWFYVSRVTIRRSTLSNRSGSGKRRCSRIVRNVSRNRRRSARRADARTNNSWRAFRDGDCVFTMHAGMQNERPQPHACVCADAHGLRLAGTRAVPKRR